MTTTQSAPATVTEAAIMIEKMLSRKYNQLERGREKGLTTSVRYNEGYTDALISILELLHEGYDYNTTILQ